MEKEPLMKGSGGDRSSPPAKSTPKKEASHATKRTLEPTQEGDEEEGEGEEDEDEGEEVTVKRIKIEDEPEVIGCGGGEGRSCTNFFGVRSYLHQFYDPETVKNPSLYEDFAEEEEFRYLINPKRRKCSSFWFKAGLWGGINLLVVGLIILLVGYLVPVRDIIVGYENEMEILDKSAMQFNRQLDLCKLVGLSVFCTGGVVLLVTLLFPTFMYSYCDDSVTVEPFRISVQQTDDGTLPDKRIPITEHVSSVQPMWEKSALITKTGLVDVP